ncbi:MAG: 16S rRNA (uracil(1498)-N(3))-methyltransferase [Gammaproteobacteria bacterium]|nr:16S rRNA (uracil(1498)-N(3))-methyltransferase [Gammaproteobacteria bacterium]
MRTIRCFIDAPLPETGLAQLGKDSQHHLLKVLRLCHLQPIEAINGDGRVYCGELQVDGKTASINILEIKAGIAPSPLSIHLYQAVGKGDAMDYALQKATELGVREITPVFTEFSDVKLKGDRLAKKAAHWIGVIQSAVIQCERAELPTLHTAIDPAVLPDHGIMLHPYADQSLANWQTDARSVNVLIGPEGGLSASEVEQLSGRGWTGLTFGPRIMRMETAATAVLAMLQAKFGDLG